MRAARERHGQPAEVLDVVVLDLDPARRAPARAHDPDLALERALHRLGERRQVGVGIGGAARRLSVARAAHRARELLGAAG